MKITSVDISTDHWSSNWVPVYYHSKYWNYKDIKGKTFFWWKQGSKYKKIMSLCRMYPINKERVEIGDIWLNPELRGKRNKDGVKYSNAFLSKVIQKIWKASPTCKCISLEVDKNNPAAFYTYKKLRFHESKVKSLMKRTDSLMMVRFKRI